ncbi:hypothetical protein YYG_01571 [Plasmodium vinckei petteri]|uniref:Uncharacterized protein n=1 Tax=Plasmodium vinckei petteri TaxID=138298 RepID=W7ANV5_PLAVN|nr:hypothetical protein YYG_01571 [Plasmodium vinckei petteri]CAD2109031.1 conserved Plasmodium protein, unknown function [Plasmodium vinckei petteri]
MSATKDDATNTDINVNKECYEKLIKSTTFVNDKKTFECSSIIGTVNDIKSSDESIEIFMDHPNLSDHIKSVMGHMNDHFTKKINENKLEKTTPL